MKLKLFILEKLTGGLTFLCRCYDMPIFLNQGCARTYFTPEREPSIIMLCTYPVLLILFEQSKKQFFELGGDRCVRWELDWLRYGRLIDFVVVFVVERRQPQHQLIKKSPDTVEVNRKGMSLLKNHLWWHVLWTPAERSCSILVGADIWFG